MDFASVKREVDSFVKSADSKFRIKQVDEDSREIIFSLNSDCSCFSVTCPNEEDDAWRLWTTDEKNQAMVLQAIEKCDMKNCSVSVILQTVNQFSEEDSESDDETEEEMESYYEMEDFDAKSDEGEDCKISTEETASDVASNFFGSTGSTIAVKRLVTDLKVIQNSHKFGITGSPMGDDLFTWEVKLTDIPPDSRLGMDLKDYAKKYNQEPAITLDVQFPTEYPFAPPFIRVLKPRFEFLTGHVTVGGSICMQMLTNSGWTPGNDIESVLVQIRCEILSDPKARLDRNRPNVEYSKQEAKVAFDRMVKKYGWTTDAPPKKKR